MRSCSRASDRCPRRRIRLYPTKAYRASPCAIALRWPATSPAQSRLYSPSASSVGRSPRSQGPERSRDGAKAFHRLFWSTSRATSSGPSSLCHPRCAYGYRFHLPSRYDPLDHRSHRCGSQGGSVWQATGRLGTNRWAWKKRGSHRRSERSLDALPS